MEDPETWSLLNELACMVRKHDHMQTAVQLFKKALLSIKNRYKNTYMKQKETAQILIEIASTEFMRRQYKGAVEHYDNALAVLC